MSTVVGIRDNRVFIDDNGKRIELEFVVVATAAEVLREHLLALTPPELPPLPNSEEQAGCQSTA